MDYIHIKNLEVFANHGVFPEENKLGQRFLVSVALGTDTRCAGKSDALENSIDYGAVSLMIRDFMQKHTFRLIEAAAEKLAEVMLTEISGLEQVQLEIKKPWAPIGLPLETVSVEIQRTWHTAYIALGSNMGDKEAYLDNAVKALSETAGCRVMEVSSFFVTEPYGYTKQDDFVNGCLELRTLLTPEELLAELHRIENSAGRVREIRWGPRTLDLDIIFYDDLILDSPVLQIPHVEMHKRDFVLTPLSEIAPYKRHPLLKTTVKEMKEQLQREENDA